MSEEKKVLIESLTPEQEERIPEIRDKYINKFYNTKFNEQATREFVKWIYNFCELKEPEVVICDDPKHCLEEIAKITGEKPKWYDVNYYISGFNSWVPFYDYFNEVFDLYEPEVKEAFEQYRKVYDLGVFWSITFDTHCFVCKQANYKRKGTRIHCEDGPAIVFEGTNGRPNLEYYYWEGVMVPEKLIMRPDEITAGDIMEVKNLEVRRCYRERLGAKRFYDILSGGEGVKLIDEKIVNKEAVKLFETRLVDKALDAKVRFVQVNDSSTGRQYDLMVPDRETNDAEVARRSTFMGKSITYRQGDVGIIKKGEKNQFIIET